MIIKDIIDETFQDYRKPAMLIASAFCDWKCCTESGLNRSLCQNSATAMQPSVEVTNEAIVRRYIVNPITKAVVIGGLEPFLQFNEILALVTALRNHTEDDIVIYTGYYRNEIEQYISDLTKFKNIIVKFGRFVPDSPKIFDSVLGIELSSDNQYAEKIS